MKKIKHLVDPTFLRKSKYSYVQYENTELSSVLCFALSKNNSDLILHQQRIELHAKNKSRSLLFSALVDLFTALGNKGIDYRNRMILKYTNHLLPSQVEILTESISNSINSTDYILDLDHSVLNLGNKGVILCTNHI